MSSAVLLAWDIILIWPHHALGHHLGGSAPNFRPNLGSRTAIDLRCVGQTPMPGSLLRHDAQQGGGPGMRPAISTPDQRLVLDVLSFELSAVRRVAIALGPMHCHHTIQARSSSLRCNDSYIQRRQTA